MLPRDRKRILGHPEFWAIIAVIAIVFGNAGYLAFSLFVAQ